jgi:thioredoxin-like negative regulator of GroEL
MAYNKDGSWTGPVMWLARMALNRGDVARAVQLLRSIPNPTADAYGLILALALIEQRDIPLDAVLANLALAEAPAANGAVGELQQLLDRHPQFTPARETLAWKFLSLGRAEEAREQLRQMVEESADGQSIAAIRFGLQIHEELYAEAEVEFEPDKTPTSEFAEETTPAAAAVDQQRMPTTEVQRVEAPLADDRHKKPTDEVESVKTKTPTAEIEEPFADIPLGRANKRSGFAGPISLFGVPDLLQFFCNSRRTGVIEFSSQQGDARIRLHEGSICWAVSPSYPKVSQFLHDKEVVSAEQLESLADDRLDTSIVQLVERDRADVDKIREALREQIHLTIKELVDWLDGWFVFDSVRDPAVPRPELMFSAQGILLDVLREIDEANR